VGVAVCVVVCAAVCVAVCVALCVTMKGKGDEAIHGNVLDF